MKICYGTTRTAFVFKNYTIKIPSFYQMCYPDLKKFAKSYFTILGGFIQVMETCKRLTLEEFDFDYDQFVNFESNNVKFNYSTIKKVK